MNDYGSVLVILSDYTTPYYLDPRPVHAALQVRHLLTSPRKEPPRNHRPSNLESTSSTFSVSLPSKGNTESAEPSPGCHQLSPSRSCFYPCTPTLELRNPQMKEPELLAPLLSTSARTRCSTRPPLNPRTTVTTKRLLVASGLLVLDDTHDCAHQFRPLNQRHEPSVHCSHESDLSPVPS